MKNVTTHRGPLLNLERLGSSRNGNPRFRMYIGGFHCVTQPDSMLGYEVQNYRGKDVVATIGTHYGKATLNSIRLA